MDAKRILEHALVPRHEILKKTEAAEVLKKYGVTSDLLPKIKESDPIIEAIGAKKGDILKITRRSPTAGESAYYRIVVS